jgi:hypothetical protein
MVEHVLGETSGTAGGRVRWIRWFRDEASDAKRVEIRSSRMSREKIGIRLAMINDQWIPEHADTHETGRTREHGRPSSGLSRIVARVSCLPSPVATKAQRKAWLSTGNLHTVRVISPNGRRPLESVF